MMPCDTIQEFVDLAIGNEAVDIIVPLEKLEVMEEALARALLSTGKNSREVTRMLFNQWLAYCPNCGKQFSGETLNFLSSFYNAHVQQGYQCKCCGTLLTEFRLVWHN